MARIRISPRVEIDENELEERFIQAGGPGGQNVNKVATAVQLMFNVRTTRALSHAEKRRLEVLAGRRISSAGILTITAREHRSQQLNREAARVRLFDLLTRASEPVRPRIKTKPTRAAKRRRLDTKGKRGGTKQLRRKPPIE